MGASPRHRRHAEGHWHDDDGGSRCGKEAVLHGVASILCSPVSVFRRLFHMIDHEDIDWPFGPFQLEAELFLYRGKNRGTTRTVGDGSPNGA